MPLLGLCALLMSALAGCGETPSYQPMRVGNTMPDFQLPNLAGGEMSLADLAGEPTVVNFWATWCQPCRRELPELKALSEEGVKVIGIALDQEGEIAVAPFVTENAIDYTILLGDQAIFQQMGGVGVPYTLVIDGAQNVTGIYRGLITRDAIAEDLGLPAMPAESAPENAPSDEGDAGAGASADPAAEAGG